MLIGVNSLITFNIFMTQWTYFFLKNKSNNNNNNNNNNNCPVIPVAGSVMNACNLRKGKGDLDELDMTVKSV